jgi:hypothetical protein
LHTIALSQTKQRTRTLVQNHGSKDHEKQCYRPAGVYTHFHRLRDQQSQKQKKYQVQTHLGAEELANRNGPGAHQESRTPESSIVSEADFVH